MRIFSCYFKIRTLTAFEEVTRISLCKFILKKNRSTKEGGGFIKADS